MQLAHCRLVFDEKDFIHGWKLIAGSLPYTKRLLTNRLETFRMLMAVNLQMTY